MRESSGCTLDADVGPRVALASADMGRVGGERSGRIALAFAVAAC
jgi:hypothetical protein